MSVACIACNAVTIPDIHVYILQITRGAGKCTTTRTARYGGKVSQFQRRLSRVHDFEMTTGVRKQRVIFKFSAA
jgi:hypothetical protein